MAGRGATEHRLVNGLDGDPAVYVFFPQSGDALLFDLGSLDALSHKDLLRVRTALVSHCHIDHFVGFDRWLRVNVPHFRSLELYGPAGLAENVRAKLGGYTWNLLAQGQLNFTVHEVHGPGKFVHFRLSSDTGFVCEKIKPLKEKKADGLAGTLADQSQVLAVPLDHGTPSVCYALKSPIHFSVDRDAMARLQLKPGPWVTALQTAATVKDAAPSMEIDGIVYDRQQLSNQILQRVERKPLGYVTDIVFSRENILLAKQVLQDVECLVVECNFSAQDHERALAKKHLTSEQAACLAALVGAKKIEPFHISNIYQNQHELVAAEAQEFFKAFSQLEVAALAEKVEALISPVAR